ncbi:PLP-dependent aminotransferase family protein [Sulfurimonas sp.]|uniref:aminotransferase-like domain-containing protein n=1 Tax=Sulfurimonas sp. TaxID=2022749 RepID=UPI003D09FD60
MKRSFIREILEHTTPSTISFAGGLPDESLFPVEALRESAQKALSSPETLQYTISQGYLPLREKIAKFYCDQGFETTAQEILITSGSQQALDIISRYYFKREITVEAPSYLGAMNIFQLNSMQQSSIKLENDGINLEAFEKSFRKTKFAYLIPDFQNPTGVVYMFEKRQKVAKIVEQSQGILIEDAPYSEVYFEQKYPSISSMIPERSFHLGSFSKVLAPALRIGWIRASEALLKPLIPYKEAMDLHTNSVAQRIIDVYLEDTDFEAHLKVLRQTYAQKMKQFTQALDQYLPQFHYIKPQGGMFIYGSLDGVDTTELVYRCLEKGVVFVPGAEFYQDGRGKNEIRFNFTRTTQEQMQEGIMLINSDDDSVE